MSVIKKIQIRHFDMFFAKSLMTLMTLDTHDTRPLIFPTSRCISFFVAMKIYFRREGRKRHFAKKRVSETTFKQIFLKRVYQKRDL